MKKLMVLPLILLLLLTACQPGMVDNADPTESTTPSDSSTPPTDNEVPPTSTAPTTPTSEPQTAPAFDINDGRAFITYDEPTVVLMPDWVPPSDCLVDHLYWVVASTKECILICDEPIYSRSYVTTDTHIYFVKESEPTKVYVTPIGDFTNHQLFYESTYGKVNYVAHVDYRDTGIDNYLQFVADEKRFLLLDMTTGESTLMMEMYDIEFALTSDIDGADISFEGKPTEEDRYGFYYYNRLTGDIEIDDDL